MLADSTTTASAHDRRPLWRRNLPLVVFLVILIYAILAGAYVGFYQSSRAKVYRSSAALLIDQRPALFAIGNEGVISKLSQLRIKYTSLVGTQAFAVPVAKQARLPLSQVQGSLAATADPNTLLLTVAANSTSPTKARLIATTASNYLVAYIRNEQTSVGVKPKDQVTLAVVTPASAGVKIAPSTKKALLEGAAVFAAVTIAGALIADLLRRRRT